MDFSTTAPDTGSIDADLQCELNGLSLILHQSIRIGISADFHPLQIRPYIAVDHIYLLYNTVPAEDIMKESQINTDQHKYANRRNSQ